MKRKRYISLLLTLTLLLTLFSGCKEETPAETTGLNSTVASTVPAASSGLDDTPKVVNGVYASCENYDFTIYKGISPKCQFEFFLMSEKPLPEDAQLVLTDVHAEYTVHIMDESPKTGDKALGGLNKVLYEYSKNPQFDLVSYLEEGKQKNENYQRLFTLVYGEDGRSPDEEYSPDHPNAKEFEQAKVAWEEYNNRYEDTYQEYLNTNPSVQYYLYKVYVMIRSVAKEEQIKSMELIAGECSRTIPMKNVWLAPFAAGTFKQEGISPKTSGNIDTSNLTESDAAFNQPWSTGTSSAELSFTANEDITIKNLYTYGNNARVMPVGAELAILNNAGTSINMQWTPGTDFLIRKGEQVAMRIYWTDPHTNQFNYAMDASFVLEYQCDEKTCQTWITSSGFRELHTLHNMYAVYLWAFKGLDYKTYYLNYYLPMYGG